MSRAVTSCGRLRAAITLVGTPVAGSSTGRTPDFGSGGWRFKPSPASRSESFPQEAPGGVPSGRFYKKRFGSVGISRREGRYGPPEPRLDVAEFVLDGRMKRRTRLIVSTCVDGVDAFSHQRVHPVETQKSGEFVDGIRMVIDPEVDEAGPRGFAGVSADRENGGRG